MLSLSGLALGLGLGTKQTLLFLLPGLALVLGLILLYRGRSHLRGLVVWAASGLASFLLLGAYMFVVNQVNFGTPMGPETACRRPDRWADRPIAGAEIWHTTPSACPIK